MRRVTLFLSRCLVGLLIGFVCAMGALAISASPNWIEAPISGVTLVAKQHIHIPSQGFSCATGGKQDRCKVVLAGHPLEMTVLYADKSKQKITGCQASYLRQTLSCSSGYNYTGAKGLLAHVTISSDLGLSQQQLQGLQRQYLVTQLSETLWLQLATGVSLAAALLSAILIGLNQRKTYIPLVFACISCSAAVFSLWVGLFVGISITAVLLTASLLWLYFQQIKIPKGLTCILSSVGAFACSWFWLQWGLLALGLID